jgi:hypothetical protein
VAGTSTPPATVDAGASPPRAEKVLSLHEKDDDGWPCCPLLSDGQKLYTCVCSTTTSARLVAIDPEQRRATPVMTVNAPRAPKQDYFAAAAQGGTFFWVDAERNTVQRASIGADGGAAPTIQIDGDFTPLTPLLVDSDAMFLVASGVNGSVGSAVQLIRIDQKTAEIRSFDTEGNFQRHQFAQDATHVYVVSDRDQSESAPLQRTTKIVGLAKSDGARSDVATVWTLSTSDKLLGGYVGVQIDSTGAQSLYSIYQDTPAPNGTVRTRVLKLDPASQASTNLLERILDPARTTLWILGVVDGGVLLASTESAVSDAGENSLRSSSVLLIPAGGGAPRIVADFSRDNPILGFQAVANDAEQVYWLNRSGDLYRFSRTELL